MAATSGKRRSFYTDLDHLRKCFDKVDCQKRGFIGLKELTELVESMPDTGDSVVSELMGKLDRDNDGKVSFDDFMWLFELERETNSKKQKLIPRDQKAIDISNKAYSSDKHSSLINDSSASESLQFGSNFEGVVLRSNARRMTMPAKLQHRGQKMAFLSPISARTPKQPPANDLTDIASQMKYLTESVDSPQLNRNSKVLSWIESEDVLFEDTGTGTQGREELPSPPLSPTIHGSEETSQIGAILESVCNTKDVTSATIAKLCEHVKADPQEQQELLALLAHLDREDKGYVSTTAFAQGLQAIKNAVAVGTTTPTRQPTHGMSFRETTPPRLSEPFGTPSNQGTKPPLSSTPMLPSSAKHGFVKVDDVVNYWQKIGIEAPHDQSLEDILTEAISADPSGHISVGDLEATLEGSVITEGSQNVLRQVALKSFKSEISTLRTQVHQVSLERDKLKSSLNRTIEEKQKLITEGDDHVEMVTKNSEREKRQQEAKHSERIKEVEKMMQQETIHLQEQASNAIRDMEVKMKDLKAEEEKLREKLKYANEDVSEISQQLAAAHKEIVAKDKTITMLQRDLGSRSSNDIIDDESHMHQLNDLETELSEKSDLLGELQDKLRVYQDTCDELKAENERLKQKWMAQKRTMQKSHSIPSSGMVSKKRSNRPLSGSRSNRPLSGSHFHRRAPFNPRVNTSMDLDLAVQKQNHPVLMEEGQDEPDFVLPSDADSEVDTFPTGTDGDDDDTTDTEDDVLGKSTASLMEEFHHSATLERRRSNHQLEERRKYEETIVQLKQENSRLELFAESQQEQVLKIEEEKSVVVEELRELKYELESERRSHEVEVNILSRKLENVEDDVTKLDDDLKRLDEERKQILKDCEEKLLKSSRIAKSEISALQSELQHASSNITALQFELSKTKDKLDLQKKEFLRKSSDALLKLESKHNEQTKVMKAKNSATIELLHTQITASEQREKDLNSELDCRKSKLEATEDQLHDLQIKEGEYKERIATLQACEMQHLGDVLELQTKVTNLQGEALHFRNSQAEQDRLTKKVTMDMSEGLTSQISSLRSNCDKSIFGFRNKLDKVILKLATISNSMKDKDFQHVSMLDYYKAEISQLQQDLETAHHNLDRDKEMEELRSKLEQALKRESSDTVSSPRYIKVDAGSGQVISDPDEDELQKEETIRSLLCEIEQLKQAERQAKIASEDASRRLLEREMEMALIRKNVESLQSKLELQAQEYTTQLHSIQKVMTKNTSEARDLYDYILNSTARTTVSPEHATQLNHSQAMTESKKEVDKIIKQFTQQEAMYSDLEDTLAGKIEEHDIFEAQFTAEHEEEVSALRQQKAHVVKQLEELREHCQNVLDNQDQENTAMLQDLVSEKEDMEKQLKEKIEEVLHVYQQVADLNEEKKVLVDIIKQLCMESGRQIDVV